MRGQQNVTILMNVLVRVLKTEAALSSETFVTMSWITR